MANLKYKNSNNQWKSLSAIKGPKGDNANIILNGTSLDNISIYAPISSGLSGQILQSNGANKKPTWVEHQMPIVNNAILEIQKNESSLGTFSANASENKTINIEVPTIEDILNKVYPIGSIFISLNATNPKILFGGEWEAIQDKFLISSGSYTAGTTGGAASHSHTTVSHTLTINEVPYHYHDIRYNAPDGSGVTISDTGSGLAALNINSWNWTKNVQGSKGSSSNIYTNSEGGNQAHTHGDTGVTSTLPPFLAVYMWKRIA